MRRAPVHGEFGTDTLWSLLLHFQRTCAFTPVRARASMCTQYFSSRRVRSNSVSVMTLKTYTMLRRRIVKIRGGSDPPITFGQEATRLSSLVHDSHAPQAQSPRGAFEAMYGGATSDPTLRDVVL